VIGRLEFAFLHHILSNSVLLLHVAFNPSLSFSISLVSITPNINTQDVEIYENRKEEIVSRMFGVIDMEHPYIKHIYAGGDYLLGGEIELLDRIRYNDGLDQWRKTTTELIQEFQDKGADTVYAFQTRNPT
jgi:ATP sulfurylase